MYYYATGQEVDDLLIVNKDMIWSLSAAALQEVDRQQLVDKFVYPNWRRKSRNNNQPLYNKKL